MCVSEGREAGRAGDVEIQMEVESTPGNDIGWQEGRAQAGRVSMNLLLVVLKSTSMSQESSGGAATLGLTAECLAAILHLTVLSVNLQWDRSVPYI